MQGSSRTLEISSSEMLLVELLERIAADMYATVDNFKMRMGSIIKIMASSKALQDTFVLENSLPFYVSMSQNLCNGLKILKENLDDQYRFFDSKIDFQTQGPDDYKEHLEEVNKLSSRSNNAQLELKNLEKSVKNGSVEYLSPDILTGLRGLDDTNDAVSFQKIPEMEGSDIIEWDSAKLKLKDYPCCIRPYAQDEFLVGFTNGKSCLVRYKKSKKMFTKLQEMPQTLKPVLDIIGDFRQEEPNLVLLQPGGYRAGTPTNLSMDYDFESGDGMKIFKIEICKNSQYCIMIKSRKKLIVYDFQKFEIVDFFELDTGDILDYSYNNFLKKLFVLTTEGILVTLRVSKTQAKIEKNFIRRFNILQDQEEEDNIVLCSLAVDESGKSIVISGYLRGENVPTNLLFLVQFDGGEVISNTRNDISYEGTRRDKHYGQFNYINFEGIWDGKPLILAGTVKEFHICGFLVNGDRISSLFEEFEMSKDIMLFGAKMDGIHYFITTRREIFMIKLK